MSSSPDHKPKRRRAQVSLLAVLLLLTLGGVVYWRQLRQKPTRPTASSNLESVLPAPPFATKEPLRYQATRISTSNDTESAATTDQASVSRVSIARDGDRRREDYDLDGVIVSYLELPSGRYALLPAQGIYVDLDHEPQAGVPDALAPEFSPDRLLNQSLPESHYEKLGDEVVNGRATIKYRVTTTNAAEANSLKAETLIWVDQLLGLPIKSETSIAENGNASKFTTELQNISTEVEAKIFHLPPDFRKVSYQEFERQLRMAATPPGGR